jgi:hypothetical protein
MNSYLYGTEKNSVQGFRGKARRKVTTRRPKRGWIGIRMDLKETGWGYSGSSRLRIGTGGGLL